MTYLSKHCTSKVIVTVLEGINFELLLFKETLLLLLATAFCSILILRLNFLAETTLKGEVIPDINFSSVKSIGTSLIMPFLDVKKGE